MEGQFFSYLRSLSSAIPSPTCTTEEKSQIVIPHSSAPRILYRGLIAGLVAWLEGRTKITTILAEGNKKTSKQEHIPNQETDIPAALEQGL